MADTALQETVEEEAAPEAPAEKAPTWREPTTSVAKKLATMSDRAIQRVGAKRSRTSPRKRIRRVGRSRCARRMSRTARRSLTKRTATPGNRAARVRVGVARRGTASMWRRSWSRCATRCDRRERRVRSSRAKRKRSPNRCTFLGRSPPVARDAVRDVVGVAPGKVAHSTSCRHVSFRRGGARREGRWTLGYRPKPFRNRSNLNTA